MEFKEFFKPTKGKLILFLVVFILILIFLFPTKYNVYCETGAPCPPRNDLVPIFLIINEPATFVSPIYSVLLIELIISYLISCLIIFTYNKTKKKHR